MCPPMRPPSGTPRCVLGRPVADVPILHRTKGTGKELAALWLGDLARLDARRERGLPGRNPVQSVWIHVAYGAGWLAALVAGACAIQGAPEPGMRVDRWRWLSSGKLVPTVGCGVLIACAEGRYDPALLFGCHDMGPGPFHAHPSFPRALLATVDATHMLAQACRRRKGRLAQLTGARQTRRRRPASRSAQPRWHSGSGGNALSDTGIPSPKEETKVPKAQNLSTSEAHRGARRP